ncbi:MAG TPA: hypothetical protein VGM78_01610, partial [Ilumatobacteraceae bacterium]
MQVASGGGTVPVVIAVIGFVVVFAGVAIWARVARSKGRSKVDAMCAELGLERRTGLTDPPPAGFELLGDIGMIEQTFVARGDPRGVQLLIHTWVAPKAVYASGNAMQGERKYGEVVAMVRVPPTVPAMCCWRPPALAAVKQPRGTTVELDNPGLARLWTIRAEDPDAARGVLTPAITSWLFEQDNNALSFEIRDGHLIGVLQGIAFDQFGGLIATVKA